MLTVILEQSLILDEAGQAMKAILILTVLYLLSSCESISVLKTSNNLKNFNQNSGANLVFSGLRRLELIGEQEEVSGTATYLMVYTSTLCGIWVVWCGTQCVW